MSVSVRVRGEGDLTWISLIAAASISVSAPPLSGLQRTTAAPLERRRSSSRPSGAPASLPRSAASLNSSSPAAACGGAVRGRLAGGGGGWCVDAGAGGGAPPSRRRSSASSASLTSEASCWIGMTTPVRCACSRVRATMKINTQPRKVDAPLALRRPLGSPDSLAP